MAKAENKNVNFRDFERNNADVKKAEHLKLSLDRIKKRRGFNPRDLTKPETIEKIEGIKQAYLNGQYVPPPLVKLASDGDHVEIVDGECRYTAAVAADKEMKASGLPGIQFLEVMRFSGNDKEALVQTILSNEGERLTPLEQSDVVRRLQAMHLNRDQIAQELHKSIGWIDRLIVVAKLPEGVKHLVREGMIEAEVAVKFVKQHGEDGAEAAIRAKYEQVSGESNGKAKAKVTTKHAKGEDDEKPAKAKPSKGEKAEAKKFESARSLAFALPDKITKVRNIVEDKDYEITLPGAALKALLDLQEKFTPEIEAAIKAEREAAAAAKKAA